MQQAAWVNNPAFVPLFGPAPYKVSQIGDSTCVLNGGVQVEVINHLQLLYGDSAPTWINHAIPGSTIANLVTDGQVSAAIADAPSLVLIGCGVNSITGATYASILADAQSVLSPIRAALPNVRIAWFPLWCGHSEAWNPDPNQAAVDAVVNGVKDACAQYSAVLVDVRSTYLIDEMTNNPGQASSGINTVDGTHENWRGRPMCGRRIASQFIYELPLYPNIDLDPTWRPDADVTPALWLEADQLSAGPVTTWGPFTTYGGSPSCIASGWSSAGNGAAPLPATGLPSMPCVRFNGVSDVMTASGLSTPAGAKTLFVVYRMQSSPAGFGQYVSMLSLTNGVVSSEFIPCFTGGTDPLQIWCCDQKRSGSDGFFETGTQFDINDSGGAITASRFCSTFAGGSSTDTSQYAMYLGGSPLTVTRGSTWLPLDLTAKPALGARVSDGVTATNFAQVDVAAILLYNASLTTVQRARVDQYLRRKWGP